MLRSIAASMAGGVNGSASASSSSPSSSLSAAATPENGPTNGINGNSHHDHSDQASSSTRTLLIIHAESNTRLAVDGIPAEIYGHASNLRDDFIDHLNESGKSDKLAALAAPKALDDDDDEQQEEAKLAPVDIVLPLLVTSHWLDFLTRQTAAFATAVIPLISSSTVYFAKKHLDHSSIDIHEAAQRAKLDVDEKKLVISAWIRSVSLLGTDNYGPRGRIWQDKTQSSTNVYAVFGGQGSNEYYWDEMEYLYDVYSPLFTPLLVAGQDVFSTLATQHSSTLLYSAGMTPLRWLTQRSTRPSVTYLATCAASLPLIGLVQLCQFMATAKLQGFKTPDEAAQRLAGATGHSQGVVTASVVALGGKTWDEYVENAKEGLKVLFSIGLRGTEAFPPIALSPAVVSASVESGEGVPYPMLAVTGLLFAQLEPRIRETNQHLEANGRGKIEVSLYNGLRAFVVCGPPASLVGLVNNLKKNKAESGKDQSKIPHSKRLPVFSMRFLPVGVPYHSSYLSSCTSAAMSHDVSSESAAFWNRSKMVIPVFNTETGRDLRTLSKDHGDGDLLKELFDQIFTSNIHWKEATTFNNDATHIVDFGTGGLSGIGSLIARESEGSGSRVVIASTGTNGRNTEEVYSASKLRIDTRWMAKFGPKLVRTRHDGKIHLDTAMSRLLSKPPLMVAGMTPCTVGAGFNAAVANAGYHIELAGGGHYNARRLRDKVADIISRLETPGIGLTLNALYINQRQFTFQLPEWIKMKSEGIPVEGLCVAAGIPSTENATNILKQLKEGGLKHVSFKPGSVEGIRQVINIAAANPDFPIIMQWTGGRAGGHHSCEDFHQPMLATYASIRQQENIVLVGGSGFGGADDVWPYLSGEWSLQYGAQRMPYDGFLYASRVMVAKESHTSLSVKKLIVAAQGVDDSKWEGTYDKETGGIITVTSELGEPIHKVATRGVKLWKEFDNTVFAMPREKRAAWLADKKDYVIKRLNADFQKPWFAAKADGTVCDLGDMTYAEVASRLVRLTYVAHEKRWIDPTLRNLTGDWLRRTEDRLSEVNDSITRPSALQSYNSLNDPQPFLESFFSKYPAAKEQIIASEDIAYFLAVCQRPGQKPTPFIPVLDADFGVWFKKDSLWFAEDVEAVFDQDPQRVCILMGPVAVKHCTKVDEPIGEMFGSIKDKLIKNVLNEFYAGDESQVPEVEYLAPPSARKFGAPATRRIQDDQLKSAYNIEHSTRSGSKSGSTTHVYDIDGVLPPTAEWLEHLSGPKLDWLRAFLTSVNVAQGQHDLVENGAKKLFKPRSGQRVEVTLDDASERPIKVAVFGAIRSA